MLEPTIGKLSADKDPDHHDRFKLNPEAPEYVLSSSSDMNCVPMPQRVPKDRHHGGNPVKILNTVVLATKVSEKNNNRDLEVESLMEFVITLNGVEQLAIIDSGSQFSIIDELALRKISDVTTRNVSMNLRGIGDPNYSIGVKKVANLSISIHGIDYGMFDFVVVEHLKVNVILGMPYLIYNRIKLDIIARKFTRQNDLGESEELYLGHNSDQCFRNISFVPVFISHSTVVENDKWIPIKVHLPPDGFKLRKHCPKCNQVSEDLLLVDGEWVAPKYNKLIQIWSGLIDWSNLECKILILLVNWA